MKRFEKQKTPGVNAAIAASLAVVLALELVTPLGIAVWIFYLAPVAFSLWAWRPRTPLLVAAAATAFMAAGPWISPRDVATDRWVALLNRAMGAAAIWIICLVVRRFLNARLVLREQDWIRSGQRDLAMRVQGDHDLGTLGDRIVRFLCEYLGAPVGALYVAEPGGRLRRVATYAVGAGEGREALGPGEGLLGQAVKDGRVLRFDDVPDGYVQLSSAIGRAPVRHVLAVPTREGGEVNGGVEIGFLHPIGRSDMDLLDAVAEQIGVALRTSQDRRRLEELLGRTQRQAEELQVQQEELRVANEELESQGRALRESQVRLEQQQAELEQTNAQLMAQAQTLEHQRQGLLQAQADLTARAEELARSSQYKSEFLANMSHELRTPLNSLLILAKLLSDNRDGNLSEEQVKFASTIYSSGNDLLTLINDILDLSRIEAGRLDVNVEEVPVARVLEPLRRIFEPVAAQRGLAFEVEVEPAAPLSLHTDPLRLQQILRNLLANAFKFTAEGTVTLRVAPAGPGGLAFAVADTGEGIPRDKQEIIFEAFRQADGTTQRRHGGSGLGLTISRELAHRLGGDIALQSEPGRGSTFTLALPLRFEAPDAPPPPRAASSPPRPARTSAPPAGRSSASPRRSSAPPSAPSSSSPGAWGAPASALSPPITDPQIDLVGAVPDDRDRVAPGDRAVLVIEDDLAFAAILRDLAREQRFRCLVATTAAEGAALARRFRPAAVLLDVHLPDHSGLSVMEQLKTDAATRHIPVHVLSVEDCAQQALELGAVGFISKPAQREQLAAALGRLEQKLDQKLRRVLVVEDAPAQRDSLLALLGSEGVEVVPVATAAEALEQLNSSSFDCMVLDLNLSGVSGFELLDEMAAGESFSFPPVIVYTGRALSRDEELRLRRYASSIIIKGARSPERLLDEVTLFLHQVEATLPADKQHLLRRVRGRDAVLEGRTILVVEDDVRNVFALTSVLEPKGARVRIARNGREALAAIDRAAHSPDEPIDLVLMDVMMPEMDGLTATQEIRKRPQWKKLPIVALTAKSMPDDREKCLRAGANDYIPKPLDVDKLLSLIKVWMPK